MILHSTAFYGYSGGQKVRMMKSCLKVLPFVLHYQGRYCRLWKCIQLNKISGQWNGVYCVGSSSYLYLLCQRHAGWWPNAVPQIPGWAQSLHCLPEHDKSLYEKNMWNVIPTSPSWRFMKEVEKSYYFTSSVFHMLCFKSCLETLPWPCAEDIQWAWLDWWGDPNTAVRIFWQN